MQRIIDILGLLILLALCVAIFVLSALTSAAWKSGGGESEWIMEENDRADCIAP